MIYSVDHKSFINTDKNNVFPSAPPWASDHEKRAVIIFYRLNGSLPQTLLSGNIDNNFLLKKNKLTAFLFVLKLKLEEDGRTKLYLYKILSDYQLKTGAEHLIKILSKSEKGQVQYIEIARS